LGSAGLAEKNGRWLTRNPFGGLLRGAPTDMDITDRAIQVGGAREGQSFVLKV
jgi:hypothetical protein